MIEVRRASTDDFSAVVALYESAQEWLGKLGKDQWQPLLGDHESMRQKVHRNIRNSIDRGTCYIALKGTATVGTITLDDFADPEFWTADDDPTQALYVHRMIIDRGSSGMGLGGEMLRWAEREAARQGKRWLRLDAWRTNIDLHQYYESQGMTHVRTVSLDHRGSGALFQRAVRASR